MRRLPDVRRRRGEDHRQLPPGLRVPLRPARPLDHELHDPQPHADADDGVHDLRHRLRPGQLRGGEVDHPDAKPLWMDVVGRRAYPVFDALRGTGQRRASSRSPTRRRPRQRSRTIGSAHEWPPTADIDAASPPAGHLHPGGLYNDLTVTRDGVPEQLFRSEAKYFEPAGAVSWDVSMTATKPEWQVAVQAGRPAQGLGDLRHQERIVVRVDGDHGRLVRRRHQARREGPVREAHRLARDCSRTDTCPRTTATAAQAAPGLPRRADDAERRRSPSRDDPELHVRRAVTSACPGEGAGPRS